MPQLRGSSEASERELGKTFVFDGVTETIVGYRTDSHCEYMYTMSIRPLDLESYTFPCQNEAEEHHGGKCTYITEWAFESWCNDQPVYSRTWGPGELLRAMGLRVPDDFDD